MTLTPNTKNIAQIIAKISLLTLPIALALPLVQAQQPAPQPALTIQWDKTVLVSRSIPTLQVVVNPPLRPGEPLSKASYKAVRDLGADYVRYVPWNPYPRLVVAELEPPTPQKTSWDFSLIDPMTRDFFAATEGHPTVLNFSTIPAWLFKSEKPVTYPDDPNLPAWNYTQGAELRDSSGKELGDYFARLVSWYVNGGFIDENGIRHNSGYHYKIPIWEVLNEPEFEHDATPEQYTARYDAIVEAIHRVSPDTKFMGLALAMPRRDPRFFEYFLNPSNHKPGIPLDYISYHFYAVPSATQTLDDWQYTFFDQANGFMDGVHFIESIRKRLAPNTKSDLDELGVISSDDLQQFDATHITKPIPPAYWNLTGALYAYLYLELTINQIDIIGESQLVGYPTQFPSVSMMDWTNNKPNARFWVLKLLKDNLHPGDTLVATDIKSEDVVAQAYLTPTGHKLLLINKRNWPATIALPEPAKSTILTVDEQTADDPACSSKPVDGKITLQPFAVSVVSW